MHHLIFEGAELTGKSSTIYPVWNALEEKYNTQQGVMDGCIWFNADVGIFGTSYGWNLIQKYTEIASLLKEKNVIFEKFHLTHYLYFKEHDRSIFDKVEKMLQTLDFKIILTTTNPIDTIFKTRINERLMSNPSYKRIAKPTSWYSDMQGRYMDLVKSSALPYITVDNTTLPNQNYQKILSWIGE